jgi:hypothetical protein
MITLTTICVLIFIQQCLKIRQWSKKKGISFDPTAFGFVNWMLFFMLGIYTLVTAIYLILRYLP